MVLSLRKKVEPEEKIYIHHVLAAWALILANPDLLISELREKRREVRAKGYDIAENNFYISALVYGGSTIGDFRNASSLNESGVDMLERMVLRHYVERPEVIQRFADDIGLDLMPIFQKHIGEYLELKRF
jgi:hypothetical protein